MRSNKRFGKGRRPISGRLLGGLLPILLCGDPGFALALTLSPEVADNVATATGISAGDALLNTCVTGRNRGNQFQNDCDAIFLEPNPNLTSNAINQVAADQVVAENAAARRQFGTNLGAIGNRLTQIRLASGMDIYADDVGLAMMEQLRGDTGGGAGADADFGRLGAFFNLKYRWGDEDQTEFQPSYDFDGWAAIAGIDYRFTDNLVGGAALSYLYDDAEYDSNRGDLSSNSWGLLGYGTFYLENGVFLDAMFGYNSNDFDLNRNLIYSVSDENVSQVARSSPGGEMISFSVGGGYAIPTGALSFTPTVRLNYIRNNVDRFTETITDPNTSGGAMFVSMRSASYTSLTSRLGIQIARAFSYSGGVVAPSLSLDWIHEFENDQQSVAGNFPTDVVPNGTSFFVITNKPDRNYFDLGLAVSGQFAEGRSAFLSYNTLLGFDNLTYHAVTAGVRLEF